MVVFLFIRKITEILGGILMKKAISKLLSISMMALLVAASATSCQQDAASEDGTSSEASSTEETVKLTFKSYHAPSDGSENFVDTPVGQVIKDKFNIELSFFAMTADNIEQAIITDIASGDIADIVGCFASPVDPTQRSLFDKAARENVFADLSGEVANYPIINEAIQKDNLPLYTQDVIYNPSFGDSIYFLPANQSVESPWLSGWGFYIRGDIAKEIGLSTPAPEVKTPDEFFDLLMKIKEGHFTDINGKEIYPLGNIDHWPHILAAMGRPFDFGGAAKIGVVDGKVTHFMQTEYAWEQIQWYRKLLDNGLLDPESLTHSYDIGSEKMAQGRYAVTAMYGSMATSANTLFAPLLETDPNMAYEPLGNMQNHRGEDKLTVNKGAEAHQILAFSKDCNLEKALELVEWASSKEGKATGTFGKENEQWFWNDEGFAEMYPEVYEEYRTDTEWNKKMGTGAIYLLSGVAGVDNPEQNAFGGNGRSYLLQNDPAAVQEETDNVNGIMPEVNVVNKLTLDLLLPNYPERDRIEPVLNQMTDTLLQCYLANSDDEARNIYEGYVDTLEKNGLNEYMDYLQKAYDENPDKYADYVSEVQ